MIKHLPFYFVLFQNTLPFQIPIGLYNLVVYGPKYLKNLIKEVAEQRKREVEIQKQEKEEQERLQELEEERAKVREEKKLRKRKAAQNVPQKSDEELASYSVSAVKDGMADDDSLRRTNKPVSGGLWTDDDLVELVRLVKKYPGGTTNRWETIAEMMNRSVYDVTHMAAKLKETAYKVPGQADSPAEQILQEASKNKVKTRKVTDHVQAESVWTQEQQKALEAAIIKHPKSAVGDRWQKIASSVPGKTKEECLARYKYLVEFIKKQKQTTELQEEKLAEEAKSSENVDQDEELSEKGETEPTNKKPEKKSKKKQKAKHSDHDEEQELEILETDEVEQHSMNPKGKAKNKRKARKKDFEISYDDYQDSDDDDDDENGI